MRIGSILRKKQYFWSLLFIKNIFERAMELSERLMVNTPNVVHETIDGETILLDLKTGSYFSLDGSGAVIWEFIDKTGDWQQVIGVLSAGNPDKSALVSASVTGFVEELVKEGLLVKANHEIPAGDERLLMSQLAEFAGEFKPPLVNKYTDMQDLLLLDPIHEVDEKGWPESKSAEQEKP